MSGNRREKNPCAQVSVQEQINRHSKTLSEMCKVVRDNERFRDDFQSSVGAEDCDIFVFSSACDKFILRKNTVENLCDVEVSGLGNGQVLRYNGSNWVNIDFTIENLNDVEVVGASACDILVYDGVDWINQANTVGNLCDVGLSGLADGDVLVYDAGSGEWVNQAGVSGGAGSTGATGPLLAFSIFAADSLTGPSGDGPFSVTGGDVLRFWSNTLTVSATASTGEIAVQIEEMLPCFGTGTGIPLGTMVVITPTGSVAAPGARWEWAAQSSVGGGVVQLPVNSIDSFENTYTAALYYPVAPTFFNKDGTDSGLTVGYSGGTEMFVAKMNRDGEWQWAASARSVSVGFGSFSDLQIATDIDSNIYITGELGSAGDIGTFINSDGTDSGIAVSISGLGDAVVGKLDSAGTWQWVARVAPLPGIGTQIVMPDVHVSSSRAIYSSGQMLTSQASFYDGDGTFSGFTVSGTPFFSAYVAKLDRFGNWNWAAEIAGSDATIDFGYIGTDLNANAYIFGTYTASTVNFIDANGITGTPSLTGSGKGAYVAKISPAGVWDWAMKVDGVDFLGGSIVVDTTLDNNTSEIIYVAGNYSSPLSFYGQNGVLQFTQTPVGGNNIYLGRISSDGYWDWTAQVGGAGGTGTTGATGNNPDLALNSCGDLYVSGEYQGGAISFHNIDGSTGATLPTAGANFDIFVGAISRQGQWIFATQVADVGSGFYLSPGIEVRNYDKVYLTSTVVGALGGPDFINEDGASSGITGGVPVGPQGIFVAKLDNSRLYPGVMQHDGCVRFEGLAEVNANTTDLSLPLVAGREYYFDRASGKLVETSPYANNANGCEMDVYALGMPDGKIQIL